MAMSAEDILKSWERFHQEALLARNYHMAPRRTEIQNNQIPNPVLDRLLPSVLFLRMVSILDEALEFNIDERNIAWPTNKKRDLYNKIDILGDSGILRDKSQCHRIREKRNALAHDPGKFVEWSELYSHLDAVELELKNLGLVGERPRYAWFAAVTPFTSPSGQKLVDCND
jgi:hypothetical protein